MRQAQKKESIQVHCNQCGGLRWHRILQEHVQAKQPAEAILADVLTVVNIWQIVSCKGCEDVKFRRYSQIEETHFGLNTTTTMPEVYPIPSSRALPGWLSQLPMVMLEGNRLISVLKDTYAAMEIGAYWMTSIGLRTALDLVALDKIGLDKTGANRTFEEKLKALRRANVITYEERRLLSFLIQQGNASAHEAYQPSRDALSTAMTLLENTLYRVYILPREIQKHTPDIPRRLA